EALAVEADADGAPLTFTLRATGTQRMDAAGPTGTAVRLTRHYETLAGRPLAGRVRAGQVIAVRLRLELAEHQDYLLVEDRRPGGTEFAGEVVHPNVKGTVASSEFRDDRVCVYLRSLEAGTQEIVYYLRAETPGTFHVFPGCAYPMYAEQLRGETGA